MTNSITTVETPEQMAERIPPCQCTAIQQIAHNHNSRCLHIKAIAAALRAERERALEDAAKAICIQCRKGQFNDDPKQRHSFWDGGSGIQLSDCGPIRALAQKGDR